MLFPSFTKTLSHKNTLMPRTLNQFSSSNSSSSRRRCNWQSECVDKTHYDSRFD